MEDIFIIGIILFLILIALLTISKERSNKKKKQNLKNKINTGEELSNDRAKQKKKEKPSRLKLRKPRTFNLNEGRSNTSNTGQGLIASQMKKEKKNEDNLKKPIGWVQTQSYDEDVRGTNVSKYVYDEQPNSNSFFEDTSIDINKGTPNILVVDDSVTVLKFISNLLVKVNYDVVTKEDGMAAFDYLKMTNRLPDLIITDLEMPKMTGSELIQAIRKEPKLKNIPILIVSSNPTPHISLLQEGLVNGVIQKPFDREDFMVQVKYLINN